MSLAAPHFLLHAETAVSAGSQSASGRWRFVLQQPAGNTALEADDVEPVASPERLELLAIIRGLEALDQPSRVTLVSASRSVAAGLRHGLANWRQNDWQWERYGKLTAVKNADLWQRLDRLLEIHRVDCRPARSKPADDLAAPPRQRELGGKRLRFDRGTKREANSNERIQTTKRGSGLRPSNFLLSMLFRISGFVLRAWRPSS